MHQEGLRRLRLPAESTSVPEARRFVRAELTGAAPDDLVASAELCATELVTNAILHAGTEIEVVVEPIGETVRIGVSDGSPVVPRRLPHTRASATGRGLGLVAVLSQDWGVDPEPGAGKTVWCLLPVEGPEPEEEALLAAWDEEISSLPDAGATSNSGVPPVEAAVIRLLRYPVRRGLRIREHHEGLRRECQLLALAGEESLRRIPQRLLDMAAMLSVQYDADLAEPERRKLEAFADGRSWVDLTYPARPETAAVALAWRDMAAEMDQFCREESLLTLATPPDVAELQAWVLGEFLRQIDGKPPCPWDGPLD